MYANKDFSPFDSSEADDFSFDFAKRMTTDETITEADWFCLVAENSLVPDPDPQSHVGTPSFSGTKTICRISGLLSGARYTLQAIVVTSLGKTLSLWSHTTSQDPE